MYSYSYSSLSRPLLTTIEEVPAVVTWAKVTVSRATVPTESETSADVPDRPFPLGT
jgi:hypothetical protein